MSVEIVKDRNEAIERIKSEIFEECHIYDIAVRRPRIKWGEARRIQSIAKRRVARLLPAESRAYICDESLGVKDEVREGAEAVRGLLFEGPPVSETGKWINKMISAFSSRYAVFSAYSTVRLPGTLPNEERRYQRYQNKWVSHIGYYLISRKGLHI